MPVCSSFGVSEAALSFALFPLLNNVCSLILLFWPEFFSALSFSFVLYCTQKPVHVEHLKTPTWKTLLMIEPYIFLKKWLNFTITFATEGIMNIKLSIKKSVNGALSTHHFRFYKMLNLTLGMFKPLFFPPVCCPIMCKCVIWDPHWHFENLLRQYWHIYGRKHNLRIPFLLLIKHNHYTTMCH